MWGKLFKPTFLKLEFVKFPEVRPYYRRNIYSLFPSSTFCLLFFLHKLKATLSWLLQNWKLQPLFSLFCAQDFLAFSDNIVIHFLSSQNRYQDMIVKTLNCELRRAHIIRQAQARKEAVHTAFLSLFFLLSRRTGKSKHLIYYYPVTEHDILIQSGGTHNKLEITLNASLV